MAVRGRGARALRDKIVKGRKTLGEVYGAPLYGIKTGLNEAFIIDTPNARPAGGADAKSAELLKPFLKGENIKRWRVEPEGLWLINTPKGKVISTTTPPSATGCCRSGGAREKRATKQEWFELQQAQLAYQPHFESQKILYPFFKWNNFAFDETGTFSNDTCYSFQMAT